MSELPETIEEVISWLQGENPEDRYNPSDPSNCILCQIISARGFVYPRVNFAELTGEIRGTEEQCEVDCAAELVTLQERWIFGVWRRGSHRITISVADALRVALEVQQELKEEASVGQS